MNVLLLKPPHGEIYKEFKSVATEYPPLGLAYLASVLREGGHKVKIIDVPAENLTEEEIISKTKSFKPDLVGLTLTTPTSTYAHHLADKIKKELGVMIFLGGPHATAVPEETLKLGNVDYVVRGEGEYSTLELVNVLEKGADAKNVLGISYKEGDNIVNNKQRPYLEDLDALPFPARDLLPLDKYYYVDARANPVGTILTSRGCPGGCVYCNKNIFGPRFRARSPENVLLEFEEMIEKYKMKEIHIIDDTFTLDNKRAIAITDGIIKKGWNIHLALPNGIRVDTVTEELLSKLKKAGLYTVSFGVESGSQEVLDTIRKGITPDQVRNAFNIARKVDLETWGFFMVGLPGDTKESMRQTIDFAKELDPDIAKFHVTIPFPGTKLYDEWSKKGIIDEVPWQEFGIHNVPMYDHPNLSREEIVEFHKLAYKEFYLRPGYILSQLKRVKSPRRFYNMSKAAWSIIKMTQRKGETVNCSNGKKKSATICPQTAE